MDKAAKRSISDDNSAIPKGEPSKKILKFDINKRKVVYVDEDKGNFNSFCHFNILTF